MKSNLIGRPRPELLDVLPLGQRQLVLRRFGVILGHDDGVGHDLPVAVAEVVSAEAHADRRCRVRQLGRENVAIWHRWRPNGHVLLPPNELKNIEGTMII